MFWRYFTAKKEALLRRLEAADNINEQFKEVMSFFRSMKIDCESQVSGNRRKDICRALIDIAIIAVSFMQSRLEVDTFFKSNNPSRNRSTITRTSWWYYIGVVISLGLAFHCLLSNLLSAAVACVVLSILQVFVIWHMRSAVVLPPEEPETQSTVRLNVNDIMNHIDSCVRLMDERFNLLSITIREPTIEWSDEAMSIIQKIWWDKTSGGNQHTLDLVDNLLERLEEEGLTISTYTRELDRYFDKMSGRRDGETLLPVVMYGGHVFARGILTRNN